MNSELDPGDPWPNHYRGYRLHTNPDGEVWWQVYQGTDRLYFEPSPDKIVSALLDLKRLGGRVRVTEAGDVITRIEMDDEFQDIWVGECSLDGELVPIEDRSFSVPLQPSGVEPGDLWPSVYDGAKYSFAPSVERIWWTNPSTHKRHPVQTALGTTVERKLATLKPRGGSFRVTPWNDILTLVDFDRISPEQQQQFTDLPRVMKNIIKLRKERGVEKIPIYVGSISKTPLEVSEPPSLTDPVSSDDLGIEEWASSLGTTSEIDEQQHQRDDEDESGESEIPADDPTDW
jgi:hypothetical protein